MEKVLAAVVDAKVQQPRTMTRGAGVRGAPVQMLVGRDMALKDRK